MSRRYWIITAAAVVLVTAAAGTGLALLAGDVIYPGVSVAEVHLGGLTVEQAESQLAPRAPQVEAERVVLKYAGETLTTTVAEIGGKMDARECARAAYRVGRQGNIFRRISSVISARRHGVRLLVTYSFGKDSSLERVRAIARKINREPANAKLVVEEDSVRVIPEKPGIRLDVERNLEGIGRAVNAGAREVDMVVAVTASEITTADFGGIDGVIASYSTPYNSGERDRTHNMKIACQAVDGTLVGPGDTFSYNEVVGPRLKKLGFRDAPIFVKGQIEPGTGGGVCQVSTTLYNAALLANMKILARSHHSRPVVYAPVGRDATVAYSSLDLKFESTTEAPIYILASVGKRTVNVTMLGKKRDGQEVTIVAAGHKVIAAPIVEEIEQGLEPDERVVRNPGRAGHRVSIYRIVKLGGKVTKREFVSKDYYEPEDRIVAVPRPTAM